ncbi:MAG: response regulator, partial [Planctomycetes bacterium]|nr:response regulator [Planctomycetota bacterium]
EVHLQYIDKEEESFTIAKIRDLSSSVQSESELRDSYKRLGDLVEETQKMTDLAELASRTKDEFLANMSHEMRTPLNGILGMVDLIEHCEINPEVERFVDVIKKSGKHLTHLINDILDISHLETKMVKLERRVFDIRNVFEEFLIPLKLLTKNKGLLFSEDIVTTIPQGLVGDPNRLRQILFNIISNAIKFTQSGSISFKAHIQHRRKDQLSLQFTIKDTGIGIPQDLQEKIFQPFVQVDGSLTRHYGGSGIGLAISGKLINLMHGDIQLDSQNGVGSTFTITIPFAISQHQDKKEHSETNLILKHRALSCLLAEDDVSNQLVIGKMLEKLGHKVSIVDNGQSALESYNQDSYDLLLLDVQMPELTGIEVTERIRFKEAKNDSIPILGVTALARGSDAVACIEAGMDRVLTKPISMRNLKSAIFDCIHQR